MKTMKRIISLVVSVIMICSITVTSFAADYTFAYYFADDKMETIYVTAFNGTVPEDGYVEIPEEIDGYKVVGIAEHTFDNQTALKGVIITENMLYIDEDAFYGCGNVEIQVKKEPVTPDIDSDEKFEADDWYEEHKQDYIINGNVLVSYKGTDEIVTIPYNCSEIAPGAFKNNKKIRAVYFEKEIKKIGESAFEGCSSLEKVVANNGVYGVDIGKNAFKGTPWLEEYPSDLVTLGTTLVKYKGNASYVAIPNVFTAIAAEAFYVGDDGKNIAFKVRVPYTIEIFGADCFYLYDSVSKVYPELVIFEGSKAVEYCETEGLGFTYAALPGDADRNGVVTASDARYVLRISAKLENPIMDTSVFEVADISGDSKISAEDARLILRVSAKLDKYSAEELLSMPRSDYEVLFAASNALSLARAYGAAYSKFEYQEITDYSMNINSKTYFASFKNKLTSENKAQTVTYNQDSQEAYDNLFDITLLDATKIKNYSCVLKDGYYVFTITLNDETMICHDVTSVSATEQAFPVATVGDFTSELQQKYWYNDSIHYNLTYNDCTLVMKVDVNTNKIANIDIVMNYDFEISGKIMGIEIKGDNGPATATRKDVVKYTNFVYFSK